MNMIIWKVKRIYRKLLVIIGSKLFAKQIALEKKLKWLNSKQANLRTTVNVLERICQYPRKQDTEEDISLARKRLVTLKPKLLKWEKEILQVENQLKKYSKRIIT